MAYLTQTANIASDRSVPLWAIVMTGVLVAIAGLAQILHLQIHGDISWLLIVADKMIGGERLYVDVVEVNPPLSVMLYYPASWLEHQFGFAAETSVKLGVFAAIIASLAMSAAVLKHLTAAKTFLMPLTLPAIVAILIAMPSVFAQREHIGIILLLPYMATLLVRSSGKPRAPLTLPLMFLVGLSGALLIALKPHYALGIALPLIAIAWRERSIKPFFRPENIAMGATLFGVGMWTLTAYPDYARSIVPLLLDVYQTGYSGMGQATLIALTTSAVPIIIALYINKDVKDHRVTLLVLSSVGFALAAIAQGKGWDYHYTPAIVVAQLALCVGLALSQGKPHRPKAFTVVTASIIPILMLTTNAGMSPLKEIAYFDPLPRHATMVTTSTQLKLIHPIARYTKAQWAGRDATEWVVGLALEKRSRLAHGDPQHAVLETHLADALARKRAEIADLPSIVVVDPAEPDVHAFFFDDSEIQKLMESYTLLMKAGPLEYYTPNISSALR